MAVRLEDTITIEATGAVVGVFQLVQWKHALKLEGRGLRFKGARGTTVLAEVKRRLGLPARRSFTRERTIAVVVEMLDQLARPEMEPGSTGSVEVK